MLKMCSLNQHFLKIDNRWQTEACNLKNIVISELRCSHKGNFSSLYWLILRNFELKQNVKMQNFWRRLLLVLLGTIRTCPQTPQLLPHTFALLCKGWLCDQCKNGVPKKSQLQLCTLHVPNQLINELNEYPRVRLFL